MDESTLKDIRFRNELRKANAIQTDDSVAANADVDKLLIEVDSLSTIIDSVDDFSTDLNEQLDML